VKLCEKCTDDISRSKSVCWENDVPRARTADYFDEKLHDELVPEAECEQWAHKELNDLTKAVYPVIEAHASYGKGSAQVEKAVEDFIGASP
jgi:hypothetical protein